MKNALEYYICNRVKRDLIMYRHKSLKVFFTILTLICSIAFTNVFAAVAIPDDLEKAKVGQELFKANCASCHAVNNKLVGPALNGVWDRWESEEKLVAWVQNSQKFLGTGDAYANKLFAEYNKSVMSSFPQLDKDKVIAILAYVKADAEGKLATTPVAGATPQGGNTSSESSSKWILWALFLILGFLALLLLGVTSKLDKVVKENAGEEVDNRTFTQKILSKKSIKILSLILGIALVYNIFGGAIDLGRSQGYAPEQPIKFSHALHVGQNKIECQYCHVGVEKSKHAVIPGTQVCMNCHKSVQKGPKYGTEEIAKIYKYAGWNADSMKFVSAPKDIEWVKIHNLPDHVYFNHSQHVKAGKVACQTCHGKVEEYEVMKQFAPLSMGWCINCHRNTEVQFADNKYYSIFEKYHDDIKKGKKSKVTVENIGGTECQKCHY